MSQTLSTYQRLSAEFEHLFHDNRGGASFDYITGEQCISRLNDVLGPGGWSFTIKEHGINTEADEVWVLGKMDAWIDGVLVTREQFGSQKLKRARKDSSILDIGFDLKGAATDALKKCASLIGVALYLYEKQPPPGEARSQEPERQSAPARTTQRQAPAPAPAASQEPSQSPSTSQTQPGANGAAQAPTGLQTDKVKRSLQTVIAKAPDKHRQEFASDNALERLLGELAKGLDGSPSDAQKVLDALTSDTVATIAEVSAIREWMRRDAQWPQRARLVIAETSVGEGVHATASA